MTVEGKTYKVFSEKDPTQLPWGSLGIDLVFECTGIFTKKDALEKHIQAGAKNVILSAPTKSEGVETVVYGSNGTSSCEKSKILIIMITTITEII